MLPKNRRLPGSFFTAPKRARILDSPNFRVSVSSAPEPPPRFSCVVSKKVASAAVARNRLRRQMYLSIDDLARSGVKPLAVVINLKKTGAELTEEEMGAELIPILKPLLS